MKQRLIILVAVLVLLLAVTPAALAQTSSTQTLTIKGQLTNQTSGQPGPADVPLMLHTYQGRQMAGMLDGKTGPDGTFVFENVESTPGLTFEVMASVGQTTYFSQRTTPNPDSTTLELPVTVYESTPDTSQIRVQQMEILVEFFSPTLVEVAEVYLIDNTGDRTVEGGVPLENGQTAALEFTLPANAENLSFERGELGQRFFKTEAGFADSFGVPPGEGSSFVVARYYLPYSDGLTLERTMSYPTGKMDVVIPQAGVQTGSSGLNDNGIETLRDERKAQIYSADALDAGYPFSIELTGKPQLNVVSATPQFVADSGAAAPQAGRPVQSAASSWPVVLGLAAVVIGVALVGGGVWWLRRPAGTFEEDDYISAEIDDEFDDVELEEALPAPAEFEEVM